MRARVAELVDARDLKSLGPWAVPVRVRARAPAPVILRRLAIDVMGPFEPTELRLGDCALLGQGVWGSVFDLGDGTVLKLGRRFGGIGDGHQKVHHEVRVLKQLQESAGPASALVPTVIDVGEVDRPIELAGGQHTIWVRQTKLEGRPLTLRQVEKLSVVERGALGERIAAALALLYDGFESAGLAGSLEPTGGVADFELGDLSLSTADLDRLEMYRRVAASLGLAGDRPLHGDFNISNLLVDDSRRIVGVVDFAETRIGRVEEDICAVTSEIPDLREGYVSSLQSLLDQQIDRNALEVFEIGSDLISMIISRYRYSDFREAERLDADVDRRLRRYADG